MLFRYIFAFRLFSEVWLMTQGGPARSTEVVALYLYVEAFRYNRFGVATATGWIMVLASALVALVYLRRVYREMFAARGEGRLMRIARRGRGASAKGTRLAGRVPIGWRLFKALMVALVVAWSIGPIVAMFLASLRPPREIFDPAAPMLFTPSLDSYRALLAHWPDFFAGMANSGIVTVFATALAVLASALAGYAYSRLRTRAMALSAFGLVFLRLIPPIVTTLPLFPIVNWLRLNDTHLILILLYATFFVSLGTMVMRTFMDQIPVEIDEAALVDGASHVQLIGRDHAAARGAGHDRGRGVRHRLRLERVPVRLHLHHQGRQDRAAGARRDDGRGRRRRLGRAVRRRHRCTCCRCSPSSCWRSATWSRA